MRFIDLDWDKPTPPEPSPEPEIELLPAMEHEEIECLRRHLKQSRNYLEFGSGGSTLLAVDAGVDLIQSVESDVNWIAKLAGHPRIAEAIDTGRVLLHHADVGPTGSFGRPADERLRDQWSRYYTTIWPLVHAEQIDLVLVDGRFRVRCLLEAVRRCRPDTLILFHDFWNRGHYHVVLNHLEWVDSVKSLAVFRPRRGPELAALADHYAYVSG